MSFLIMLLDQFSKYIVRNNSSFATNTGAAFGILKGNNFLLSIIAIIAAVIFIYLIIKYKYFELGFLLGGTLGNLIDRIILGHVIDFISLPFWPSFNIADSFNTIGAIILAVRLYKK